MSHKTIGNLAPQYRHLAPIIDHYLGEFPLAGWEKGEQAFEITGHWGEDGVGYRITCPSQLRDLILELPKAFADLASRLPQTAEIVTRYGNDDPRCIGDYCEVQVFLNGALVKTYGDWYHDHGSDKAAGFVDGLKALNPQLVATKREVADFSIDE